MLNQNYSASLTATPAVNNDNTFAALTPENIELIAQLVKSMQLENVGQTSIPSTFVAPPINQAPLMHFQPNVVPSVQYAASCLETDTLESSTFSRLVNGKLLPKDYMCHLCFEKVFSFIYFFNSEISFTNLIFHPFFLLFLKNRGISSRIVQK